MFDFLKVWKKEPKKMPERLDIAPPEMPGLAGPSDLGPGLGEAPPEFPRPAGGLAPEQPPAFRAREAPLEMPQPPAVESSSGKEFQLINAKLDAIKAGIDHIHARLDKIERKEEKEVIAWR